MRNCIVLPLSLVLVACSAPSFAPPPTVKSTTPVDKATNVPRNATIGATFSETMIASTLSGSAFSISPAVAGSLTANGNTLTFTPAALLDFGVNYTATITTAAQGEVGGPLAASYSWSFTTVFVAPVVVSTTPASNAAGVDVAASVTATFSKAMSPATITTTSFTVAPAVAGTVTYSGMTATFTPSAPLAFFTVYTATITTDAKDAGGTPLAANYTWTFTTGADVPPTVVSTSPANNATNVNIGATVSATFSKAMLSGSLTSSTFTVSGGVTGTVSYSGTTATFTPASPLTTATPYTATITTGAKDAAGTALAAPYTWNFSTTGAPVANAGPDQDVNRGAGVTLDGSKSSSPSSSPLSYAWTQVWPTPATISPAPTAKPTFTAPPDVGTVRFQLVVSDNNGTSSPSYVQINVMENATKAVFVSKTGSDSAAGTRAAPLLTIQAAINNAVSAGAGVYVGAGTYSESLTLATGVSIYGGFDDTWIRNPSGSVTQILGGPLAIFGNAVGGLTIDGLTVISANATTPGSSSYGFRFANSTVTVQNNHITAGSGADGSNGSSGPAGSVGANGGNGTPGYAPAAGDGSQNVAPGGAGGGPSTASAGGNGGSGHIKTGSTTGAGDNGIVGSGSAGGTSGIGGVYQGSSVAASSGGNGGAATAAGTAGTPGGAGGTGTVTASGYVAAYGSPGNPGGSGSGGGGGGGGGGWCDSICNGGSTGNGGGGGGQGGGGGGGGTGGQGGGGSFGIFSYSSTITKTNNVIQTGSGGNGGPGGAGGPGGGAGTGGLGGTAHLQFIGAGGNGGAGSAGGQGGTGGAGGAGPAANIYP